MGVGPGKSIQRTNLPLAFSDYVYAFIIEEYGIVIAIFILFLFLWLFYRSALVFKYCEKSFPGLLVLGLGSMITCQALANMVVSVGGPVTGLPMPYLSLGGSSVLFTSIMLGMLLGISRQMREQSLEEPKEKN
jgi:cell division protein FtsW